MSVDELKKIIRYISEYAFKVKFDKNGNFDEFDYDKSYKRGIYSGKEGIRDEMIEIFGKFDRNGSRPLYDMSYYAVGIDYEEDKMNWAIQQFHLDLNFMAVFGQNNEFVFHKLMSLPEQLRQFSFLLERQKQCNYSPFEPERKLDIYSYVNYRNLIGKLTLSVLESALAEVPRSISEITWVDQYSEREHLNLLETLEDGRDCTFCNGVRVSQLIMDENDPVKFAMTPAPIAQLYLTPNFVAHFDIRGLRCFKILRTLLRFKAINLGFGVHFQNCGNVEQQQTVSTTQLVAQFRCLMVDQQRKSVYAEQMAKLARDDRARNMLRPRTTINYMAPKFDIEQNLHLQQQSLTFPPCPFYIRYQREDETDENSPYFLNDFNMCHSHPLNLKNIYLEKSQMVDRIAMQYA